jgi:RHS repeat-associated protein
LDGNLVEKVEPNGPVWRYEWSAAGMLARVHRPDGSIVAFRYDALGRRVSKAYRGQTTYWVWDGNNPLHEWVEGDVQPPAQPGQTPTWSSDAEIRKREAELADHLSRGPPRRGTKDAPITWLFEPESFAPIARLEGEERHSIISDHLGTPVQMIDQSGDTTWACDVSAFGDVRQLQGDRHACPFRWPGQYEDVETGLHYNRFRYYDPQAGQYISQDPIGLEGSSELYAYVGDPLTWHDPMGLGACGLQKRKPSTVAKLRKDFSKKGGARSRFLKKEAAKRGATKKYGKAAVARMKKGQVPKNMVVHHKKPLFRGGDNRSSNLALMSKKKHRKDNKKLHYYPEGQNPFGLN